MLRSTGTGPRSILMLLLLEGVLVTAAGAVLETLVCAAGIAALGA